MDGPDATTSGRQHDVEHAIQPRRLGTIEDLFAGEVDRQDDDVAFFAGLRVAVPVGLGIWALIIWSVLHFLV